MNLAIETECLGKTYGTVKAVENLSLRVAEGEIYAAQFSAWCNPGAHRLLAGHPRGAALCPLRQPGAGLPAAHRRGGAHDDDDEPGPDPGLGRILSLGRPGLVWHGKNSLPPSATGS